MENTQTMVAMPQQANIRPAFTVEKLEGTVSHTKHIFDKKDNKIKSKVVDEPAGFLVTFAKGHSIRCKDKAHLEKIGAGLTMIPLVDTQSGDVKGAIPNAAAN